MNEAAISNVQDFGLLLDIIGVLLVAKYHVPAEALFPDGTDILAVNLDEAKTGYRKRRFKLFRTITITAYCIIIVGFVLQTNTLKQLLQ